MSRKFGDGAVGTGEIRPTDTAPVLVLDGSRLAPQPVAWGFPKWDGKGVIRHARCETAHEKRIFAKPLHTRRCIIPSTGFYEWVPASVFVRQLSLFPTDDCSKAKEPKIKLRFRRPGEKMLYMAGIMDTFTDKDGNAKDAFVVLTTAASTSMRLFHDRMPVILSANECEDWARSEKFMCEVFAREGAAVAWMRC